MTTAMGYADVNGLGMYYEEHGKGSPIVLDHLGVERAHVLGHSMGAAVTIELIPGARLAVLPGTTHMQATRRTDLLVPMLTEFLD